MSRSKSSIDIVPRLLGEDELARYLGRSPEWLRLNRPRLEAMDFPRPHPLFGRTDRGLVDRFIERTGSAGEPAARRTSRISAEATLVERAAEWES